MQRDLLIIFALPVGNNYYGIIPCKTNYSCCTVWGHCAKEQLNKLFRLQKRGTAVIVNAKFLDNSLSLSNTQLAWLAIDDTYYLDKKSIAFS